MELNKYIVQFSLKLFGLKIVLFRLIAFMLHCYVKNKTYFGLRLAFLTTGKPSVAETTVSFWSVRLFFHNPYIHNPC